MNITKTKQYDALKNNHFNNPELKQLIAQVDTAWWTLLLLAFCSTGWVVTGYLGIQQVISTWVAILLNAIFAYISFTILHDASHRSVSKNTWINDIAGRIAIVPLIPLPVFKLFRFVHMQHHRFANESCEIDPDAWTSTGKTWTYPLRWMTLDLYYFWYYFPLLGQRPAKEKLDLILSISVGVLGISLIILAGYGMEFLLFWVLPSRLAIFFLAYAFDYLPHMPKKATQQENPYQATNNRIGYESLMTPLFLYQNYHLIHHLYPKVPFYYYLKIWRLGKQDLKQRGALSLDWKGREVS